MKRKKHFYSWFNDEDHPLVQSHSEALRQVSGGSSFISQFQQHKGKLITLVTLKEPLTGTLEQVYTDHVLLRVSERVYYIPIASIVYFYE